MYDTPRATMRSGTDDIDESVERPLVSKPATSPALTFSPGLYGDLGDKRPRLFLFFTSFMTSLSLAGLSILLSISFGTFWVSVITACLLAAGMLLAASLFQDAYHPWDIALGLGAAAGWISAVGASLFLTKYADLAHSSTLSMPTASSPLSDPAFGTLHFNTPVHVDSSRLGRFLLYQHGTQSLYYCVAPLGTTDNVQLWAVGEQCCGTPSTRQSTCLGWDHQWSHAVRVPTSNVLRKAVQEAVDQAHKENKRLTTETEDDLKFVEYAQAPETEQTQRLIAGLSVFFVPAVLVGLLVAVSV